MIKKTKWKMEQQSNFLIRLGELLEHGYSLTEAISFLSTQESAEKKIILKKGLLMLKQGYSLLEMLEVTGFNRKLISYVHYSEQYGNLPHALKEGGTFWKNRCEDLKRLKKVFLYPLSLFIFLLFILQIVNRVILPKFSVLLNSLTSSDNPILVLLLSFLNIVTYIPYLLIILFLISLIFYKIWYCKLMPEKRKRWILAIPLCGQLQRLLDTYFLSGQLSSLLSGGLSILECMELLQVESRQPFFTYIGEHAYSRLLQGYELGQVFDQLPYFEQNFGSVIANGNKNGKLDKELFHYSQLLIHLIEEKIAMYIRFLQPIIFIFIGLMVLVIYLAVLLPMFSIMEAI
ncbi:competence type IV pilus assembly protein ComGB [Peribacillus alkalitolerans]|uniref:competence type IV pilus assembly protein ComGB n=1 Tax=Peribacillus alkalitolerans TaxID=1550385 RepID=UPI0013D6E216|nr:competence type IV pilus assembly protein ComGB [Peribacillus alkalitolerans]